MPFNFLKTTLGGDVIPALEPESITFHVLEYGCCGRGVSYFICSCFDRPVLSEVEVLSTNGYVCGPLINERRIPRNPPDADHLEFSWW